MEIKIFQMNDCDWMAAATAEEALKEYREHYCGDELEPDDPLVELTVEQMAVMEYYDEETGETRSFQEQLNLMILSGEVFPTFFASTEF